LIEQDLNVKRAASSHSIPSFDFMRLEINQQGVSRDGYQCWDFNSWQREVGIHLRSVHKRGWVSSNLQRWGIKDQSTRQDSEGFKT